jgi:hypothetical protein
MKRRNRVLVTAAMLLSASFAVYAAMSSSWKSEPNVIDRGGGITQSSNYITHGSIDQDGPAGGVAESAHYRHEAAFPPPPTEEWVHITQQPDPQVIGTGGTSRFKWESDRAGTYQVIVVSTSDIIDSGNCAAGQEIETSVNESDLPNNTKSEVKVTVTDSGSEQSSASVWITDDQLPPQFTALEFTRVEGTVSDSTVSQVVVNGQAVPVIGGTFTGTVPSGTTEVTVEATNASGQTSRRVVQIVR